MDRIHLALESIHVGEGGDVQRHHEMPVASRQWSVAEVAEARAIGCAGEQRRQHTHDHGDTDALESTDGAQQAVEGGGRIGGRAALRVEGPVVGDGLALLAVDDDLAHGRAGERGVEDEGRIRRRRYRHRQGIDADNPLGAAPGRHGGQGVGGGDADHVGLQRLHGIPRHGAAVIGMADGRERHTGVRGASNGVRHRERAGDLPHGVAAVDDQRGAGIPGDARPAGGIHTTAGELGDVVRHAHGAVGVDATKIGARERGGEQTRVAVAHAAGLEQRCDYRHEILVADPSLVLGPGVCGHGVSS